MKRVSFRMRVEPLIGVAVLNHEAREVGRVIDVQRISDQEGQPSWEVWAEVKDSVVIEGLQVLGSVGSLN